ncbi:NAD(P)H-hydrate dehydratase [Patescibacteria group bacterium]
MSTNTKLITKRIVKLPKRRPNSRKGDNGRVLIIGGSPGYIGAPALAGIAAMRSGADSVIVAAPEKVAWAVNTLSADLMTRKLPGPRLTIKHYNLIKPLLKKTDCLLIGSGIAERSESLSLIKKITQEYTGYKILDAAALVSFSKAKLKQAILTPNFREYTRLKKYCQLQSIIERGNIVIKKGPKAKIYSHRGVYENKTGNAGLTKAGTGDVLAGLTAGYLAQSHDLLQSAINAVYYLGQLAEVLRNQKKGYTFLASDLAEELKRLKNNF